MKKQKNLRNENNVTLWKRVEYFAAHQPKKTFYIMFGLIFFSVVFSIGNLIYVQKVSLPEYELLKKDNIFNNASASLGAPIRETEKILDLRDALKELDYYRRKPALSSSDSIRIKYLLDKYKINKRK